MKMTLEDGIETFQEHGLNTQEKRFKFMLEPVNKALAGTEKQATNPSSFYQYCMKAEVD